MSAEGALAMDLLNAGLAREHVARRIADFRRQILAEATAKIREYADSDGLDYYSPQGLGEAADLIDPERGNNGR